MNNDSNNDNPAKSANVISSPHGNNEMHEDQLVVFIQHQHFVHQKLMC